MITITHYTPTFDLPIITLIAKDGKLVALDWFTQKSEKLLGMAFDDFDYQKIEALDKQTANGRVLLQAIQELDEYFEGKRTSFGVPLDLSCGTPFQQQVWQALLSIPYGQTISYATLAKRINKPTAFRACANANGKNPISLIIPCHRVIASGGGLGGYTGGIDIKKTLLNHEDKVCDNLHHICANSVMAEIL